MYVKWSEVDTTKDRKLTDFPLVLNIDGDLSIHKVTVLENKNFELYYMFEIIYGQCIMNYAPWHYKILQEKLPIQGISIFQADEKHGVIPVSENYRIEKI